MLVTQGETVSKSNMSIRVSALLVGRMRDWRAWHFLKQRVPCTLLAQSIDVGGACLKYQAHEALIPLMAVVV